MSGDAVVQQLEQLQLSNIDTECFLTIDVKIASHNKSKTKRSIKDDTVGCFMF
jgi:hypothetical protein